MSDFRAEAAASSAQSKWRRTGTLDVRHEDAEPRPEQQTASFPFQKGFAFKKARLPVAKVANRIPSALSQVGPREFCVPLNLQSSILNAF